ncbi:hypothetical protein [Microlunatus parietis]|uniref:Uncharacterized protein n=1 Tax=Microlunatus parietis TaxID=682979 RepID=A0A7Y9IDR0_9ACTN|nr:hypothetical protein [Microlunatus parietis]NYE74900.1 hypothetical protein [Microlunatus parietis]
MLIAIPGSSDLGGVLGFDAARPDALLRTIRDRFGPFRHRHVLVPTPRHHAVEVREQAHVAVAADPAVRIGILPLHHHALTLALIGRAVLAAELRPGGWTDPGQAVQLLLSLAARSRSLVWHPRLGTVSEPVTSLGERAAGLLPARSYLYELGAPAVIPARSGPGSASPDGWHVAGPPAPQLRAGLGVLAVEPVDFSPYGRRPYAGRNSVEITQLATTSARPWTGPACDDCSATMVDGLCVFCGCGPVGAPDPQPAGDLAPAGVSTGTATTGTGVSA